MHKFSLAISFGIISTIVSVSPVLSESRYSVPPAVKLSSDLASPWLLQLGNKPGGTSRLRVKLAPVPRQLRPTFTAPIVTPIDKNRVTVAIAPRPQHIDKLQPAPVGGQKRSGMEDRFLPQIVSYETTQPAGTIIIATDKRYLYLVQENGK